MKKELFLPLLLVILCLPGLFQVADGTKLLSQFADEVTSITVNLVEHEAPLTVIDVLVK